jgi:hypothetical protein
MMKTISSSDTSAVWSAVGEQPYDIALKKMTDDGWTAMEINTSVGEIVLSRGDKIATLYLHKDAVGMVTVYSYITAVPETT